MVAVARPLPTMPLPYPPTAQGRRLVIVRSTPTPRRRAGVIPASTYRRRRSLAAAAVAILLLVLSLAVRALVGGAVPDSVTAPPPQGTAGAVYVVQAGDTFWDIARVVHPAGDPRPVVARLVAAHGGAGLEIGERIPLRDRT